MLQGKPRALFERTKTPRRTLTATRDLPAPTSEKSGPSAGEADPVERGPRRRRLKIGSLARRELGPQQIYIYIYIFLGLVSGKQRDPKKAEKQKGELILGKLKGINT